jgi:hypothetical protein
MVVPRSAVDEDDSRLLPHSRTVGDQLCSFDVEEDPAVIHAHIHSASRSAAGFVALRHLREPQSNRTGEKHKTTAAVRDLSRDELRLFGDRPPGGGDFLHSPPRKWLKLLVPSGNTTYAGGEVRESSLP